MNYNIKALYFSPTGTTEKIVNAIGSRLSDELNNKSQNDNNYCVENFTLLPKRETYLEYGVETLLLLVCLYMQEEYQMYY